MTRPAIQSNNRRAGFTLIEMLIVIGVILVLITIGVIGFRSMELSSAKKQTGVNLASAEAMVKELNAIGALTRLEGVSTLVPAPVYVVGSSVSSPGDVNPGTGGRNTAVTRQQAVVKVLLGSPKNQQIVSGLPPQSLVAPVTAGTPYNPPVLADAWGNPLMYVPSGGMTGLTVNNVTNQTVRSTGITSPTPTAQDRAYWMSAGPDGNFTTYDDNMSSFNQ